MAKLLPPPAARLAWRIRGPELPTGAVAASVAIVACDAVAYTTGTSLGQWGHFTMLPSLVPAVALLVYYRRYLLGTATTGRYAWALFGLPMAAVAVAAGIFFVVKVPGSSSYDPVSLAAATTGEEVSFRLAWPLVIGLVLAQRLGRERGLIAGFIASGAVFCVLPGHLAQYGGPLGPLPFIAFAAISGWVVLRTGALAATATAHVAVDLLGFDKALGGLPEPLYVAGTSLALVLLVLGSLSYGWLSGLLAQKASHQVECAQAVRASSTLAGQP